MNTDPADTILRQHYFLIAGSLFFTIAKDDGTLVADSTIANAIVRHDSQSFPVHKLQKAQQNLHKGFVMKLPDEAKQTMSFHDIVITNVSYLGFMSEEEFQFQPEITPAPETPAASNDTASTEGHI